MAFVTLKEGNEEKLIPLPVYDNETGLVVDSTPYSFTPGASVEIPDEHIDRFKSDPNFSVTKNPKSSVDNTTFTQTIPEGGNS